MQVFQKQFKVQATNTNQNVLVLAAGVPIRVLGATIELPGVGNIPQGEDGFTDGQIVLGYIVQSQSPDAANAFKALRVFPTQEGKGFSFPVAINSASIPGMCEGDIAPAGSILWLNFGTKNFGPDMADAVLNLFIE